MMLIHLDLNMSIYEVHRVFRNAMLENISNEREFQLIMKKLSEFYLKKLEASINMVPMQMYSKKNITQLGMLATMGLFWVILG